jgi:hypothetical protein
MSADKEFENINEMVERLVSEEKEKYRNNMGRDMSNVELYAYTAGVYAGFHLALDWADKKNNEESGIES